MHIRVFFLILLSWCSLAWGNPEQIAIEKQLIQAKNGVFVLFTPSHGTPLMISENFEIPEGLIPAAKMASYATTLKPRVTTTQQMLQNGVKFILIRHQAHRPHAQNAAQQVDEIHYNALIKKYANSITDKIIPEAEFAQYANQNMPAAFYYYIADNAAPQYAAVFAQQIHAKEKSDLAVYHNREDDIKIVNTVLSKLDLPTVETHAG